MKVGSLFSGIGGLDLGLERAGMTITWQVEKDDYCRKVLAKHWPRVPCYVDIADCGKQNLEPVDLICGGFPCQPVSCAGKRKGDADERWLWLEFARLVCELRPRWVLAENVPGLLSADAGRLFGGILRDLAELGYNAEWELLPACAFGAPHIRYRVFILASRRIGATRPRAKCLLADSRRNRKQHFGQSALSRPNKTDPGESCANVAHAAKHGRHACWWSTEPDVGRVVDGVPDRVDRLRGLGNAVVPQVAEWIGRRIMDYEHVS
jgi:DNA (cytosine-5)-methyltransferase 1